MAHRRLILLASLLTLALPVSASAAPTAVDVRIEGKTSTIFDGPVTTDGKVVNPTTGGSHLCDGSNAAPPVGPGPTPTSALDDAAIKGGFDWAGTFFGGFNDYSVDRVASEASTASEFWGVFVNGAALPVGGCQWILDPGDEILWAFDAFSKVGALELSAAEVLQTNEPLQVKATNLDTGAPVAGATVGTATTGADGTATLSFPDPGVYSLKADKADHVRSREVRVCVDPPLVEACTSTDRAAPQVRIDTPEIASTAGRFGFVRVSWQGDDGKEGSGVRRYRVERRRLDVASAPWTPVAIDTTKTLAHVPAKAGGAYEFRVQAIDRAGNASPPATGKSLMPVDNLSYRLRYSQRGWKTLRRQGAFKVSVNRATRKGATARLRFEGSEATLITRTLPTGGRLRLTVDGKSKVVSLRGKGRFRSRLVETGQLGPGTHTLRVTSLGRAPVEIDAVAVAP